MSTRLTAMGVLLACFNGACADTLSICSIGRVQLIQGGRTEGGCPGAVAYKGAAIRDAGGSLDKTRPAPVSAIDQAAMDQERMMILRRELSNELASLQSLERAKSVDAAGDERRRREHLANIDALQREMKSR